MPHSSLCTGGVLPAAGTHTTTSAATVQVRHSLLTGRCSIKLIRLCHRHHHGSPRLLYFCHPPPVCAALLTYVAITGAACGWQARQRVDLYVPKTAAAVQPAPVVIFITGGLAAPAAPPLHVHTLKGIYLAPAALVAAAQAQQYDISSCTWGSSQLHTALAPR